MRKRILLSPLQALTYVSAVAVSALDLAYLLGIYVGLLHVFGGVPRVLSLLFVLSAAVGELLFARLLREYLRACHDGSELMRRFLSVLAALCGVACALNVTQILITLPLLHSRSLLLGGFWRLQDFLCLLAGLAVGMPSAGIALKLGRLRRSRPSSGATAG